MNSIYSKTISQLEEFFINSGDKKFRALQVFEWLYSKRINSFDDMTNIKKDMLEILKKEFSINKLKLEEVQRSIDANKYLFELNDGNRVESVLMRHDYGNSICISSQVGCNMGCKFCESGRLKKVRNLTAGEMVLQIMMVEEDIKERIDFVVVMGIGEPFDNFSNIVDFISIINHPKGIGIGARHITISTSGIVPKIKEFAELDYQVNLAISLHAPNDELRNKLMPVNKAYPIAKLMDEIKRYLSKTNRRVMIEYIMLKDVNDTEEHALELSNLVRGLNCVVNLIPYNETSHLEFRRSKKDTIMKFYDIMKKNKVNVTIRKEFGKDISAACGQLRSNKEDL